MSKWKKVLIVVFGILIVLLLVGYFVIPIKLKPLLEEEIASALSGDNEGLYKVQIAELNLNTAWSILELKELAITPDTAVLHRMDTAAVPAQLFNLKVNNLSISTAGLIALAREKEQVNFSKFAVHGIHLKVWANSAAEKKEEEKAEDRSIRFKNLDIRGLNADYRQWSDTTTSELSFKNAFLTGEIEFNQLPDSSYFNVNNDQFQFGINTFSVLVPGDLYRIETDSLRVTSDSARFSANGFRVIPLYDKREFQHHLTEQSDRIDCEVRMIQVDSMDWNALLNGGHLLASSALIDNVRLEAYRDRVVPFNESRRPKLPVRLLREIPVDLEVSSVELHNCNITYLELPEGESVAAVISFDDLNAQVSNITNRAESMDDDSLLIVKAETKLFNDPLMSATFTYNLKDINGGFSVTGNLRPFEFPILNDAIGPLTGMQINEGLHKSTVIKFRGNDFNTSGEVLMIYENLEVDTYPNRSKLRKAITRWTSKSLLYHTSNPKNGDTRVGKVSFNRDPARFVFNYWWNSYLDGVKSSVLRPGSEK